MSRLRAYFQLARVANLFTAAADVLAGFLFTGGSTDSLVPLCAMLAASVCLYAGGVVLNDVFDAAGDAAERPHRPIPSGAVSRKEAMTMGIALLAGGCALAAIACRESATLAVSLTLCIVLYDGALKRTVLAPSTMGVCRALNLLLGMSLGQDWTQPPNYFAAGMMWLYVTSVTFFARTEAADSSPWRLRIGIVGILLAISGLAALPDLALPGMSSHLVLNALLLIIVVRVGQRALSSRKPSDVQRAVKTFVLSIILFDAVIAAAAQGPPAAIAVLALLVPAIYFGRAFRVT